MIKFKKIINGSIFHRDFSPLTQNSEISFREDMAVIYGPNGTGKTSLIKVLSGEKGTSLEFEYDAVDCAKVLGYSNPRKAIIDHCKGVTKRDSLSKGGKQAKNFIPEGDLFCS